jgi:hypothetical protein
MCGSHWVRKLTHILRVQGFPEFVRKGFIGGEWCCSATDVDYIALLNFRYEKMEMELPTFPTSLPSHVPGFSGCQNTSSFRSPMTVLTSDRQSSHPCVRKCLFMWFRKRFTWLFPLHVGRQYGYATVCTKRTTPPRSPHQNPHHHQNNPHRTHINSHCNSAGNWYARS